MDRKAHCEAIQQMSFRAIQTCFIFFLLLYLILSIYTILQTPNLTPIILFDLLILLPFTNLITISILMGLILISAFLYYGWMGYDRLQGINGVLFFVTGTGIALIGLYMFQSVEPNGASISVNDMTTFMKSGSFGNSIGFVGLGIALFSIGISTFDKLEMNKKLEEILRHTQNKTFLLKKYRTSMSVVQFNRLSLIWIIAGSIIGFTVSVGVTFSYLSGTILVALIVSIIWIGIVGIFLVLYAHYKSKKISSEPEKISFEELMHRIHEQSLLRSDEDYGGYEFFYYSYPFIR